MGVFSFLQPPKKGAPLTQIAALEELLAKLCAELKDVTSIVENHGQRRADLLLSDAADADIAKLDADVALAQIRQERLELAEIELHDRLNGARDASERNRRASSLESAAEAIAAKTAAIDAAAAELALAYRDMLATIPEDLVDLRARKIGFAGDVPATAQDIAGAIAAQALASACPMLFENRTPAMKTWGAAVERVVAVRDIDRDGRLSPVLGGECGEAATISNADKAAERIVVNRLRNQARALRDSAPMAQAAE